MTDPPLGLHAPAGRSERVRRRPTGDVETQLPSPPPPEAGRLAAVWFADIVGYTSLSARDHAAALALVDIFQATARPLIEEHGGRLVKFTGDGVLAEFSSTSAAVRAANALQGEFVERSAAAGRAAELRIGVHVGEVAAGEDGDIYGDGVNTASRLEAEAQPGRVLVSEDVWRQLASRPDLRFEPLGKRRLSGIPRPIAVFEASPAAGHATQRSTRARRLVPRLTQLRGRYLLGLVAFHALAGWLLLEAIARVVARGSLSEAANPIALIWYIGAFPAILLVGWYHGYRRHRSVTRAEVALLGALAVSLIVLSASALTRQAREAALTATGFDLRRVAVLYFDDLTQGADREFLAAGLTEDLIDEFAGVRALNVISRNGVAPFRGAGLPRDSIAQLLNAGTLVDGSIEQVGERIRMNVRLVDGASGAEFRRAGFEFPADEVFELREEMVEEVSQLLRAWLGEEVELRERQAGTQSVAAWSLVQRAEENLKQADEALHEGDAERMLRSFQTADSLLASAERLDPAWAEPTVLRGTIDYRLARLSHDPHEALHWIQEGLDDAAQILQREPNHAEALELRGSLRYVHWLMNATPDPKAQAALLETARADLEEAVRLDPSLASAHSTLSHLYYSYDITSAVLAAQRAYEEDAYLDVANGVLWRLFGGSLDLGQFTQARRWCAEGAERFPADYHFAVCELMLMATPAMPPDVPRAWTLLATIDSLVPPPMRTYEQIRNEMNVGGVLARAGLPDSARAVLLRARGRITHEVDPNQELLGYEAYMRTLTGDEEEAVQLLKRYMAANPGHLEFGQGGATSWWWRSLQDQPWFRGLAADG